ncbi:hypothetical protein ACHAXT_009830 [Thalassiosira profunda]
MAPIIAAAASADEVAALSVGAVLKGKSSGDHRAVGDDGACAPHIAAEGRDDGDDAAAAEGRDGGPVEPTSNLFAEEEGDADGWGFRTQDVPPLSLMPSSSPTSSAATPSSLAGLEDVNITPASLAGLEGAAAPRFDESRWLQRQVDADEALARQLQEEEDKKRPKQKAKVNVVPSFVDSILGEPLPSEVKSSYTKVQRGGSSADALAGSISSSISSAFGRLSTAATDFFGEDVEMQVRRSSSARKPGGKHRNVV